MAIPRPMPESLETAKVMTSSLLTEGLWVLVDSGEVPRIDYDAPGATWLDAEDVDDGALLWYLKLERGGVIQVFEDGGCSYYVQDAADVMGWHGVWLRVVRNDDVTRVIAPNGRALAITVPAAI